jgi:hypothetical protein
LPLPSHTPLPVEQLITDYVAGATQHHLTRTHALRQTRIPQHRVATARRNRSGRLITEELNPARIRLNKREQHLDRRRLPCPVWTCAPSVPQKPWYAAPPRSERVLHLYYDS